MRIVTRWLMVPAAILALTGCLKLDQTLKIEPDGSGTLEVVYGMSEQTLAQMEAMEKMAANVPEEAGVETQTQSDAPLEFNAAKIREDFEAKNLEGVELQEVSSEVRDGWKFMKVKMAFDDLASLQKTDFFEDSGMRIAKNENGDYVMTQTMGSGDSAMPMAAGEKPEDNAMNSPDENAAVDDKVLESMAAIFAGMRITLTVLAPSDIVETNATEVEGNRVSWVYDIDEDPKALSKLHRQEEMRVVFSGKGVDIAGGGE